MIVINPTVDFACKAVLGSPEHPAEDNELITDPIEQWAFFSASQ